MVSDWIKDWIDREQDRLDRLKNKLSSNEETETDGENAIICPYCGNQDHDDSNPAEGEHEFTCGTCGQEYDCDVEISISYSTSRKPPSPTTTGEK